MKQKPPFESALSLKITLEGTGPAVWRRVLVPIDATLGYLHDVIQDAMGWGDEHLYDFMTGTGTGRRESLRFGLADEEDEAFHETSIRSVLPRAKSKILYIYDFGDGWQHQVQLEGVVECAPGQTLPVCTGGKNACPPEDSGGIGGYYHKLESFADPDDEYHSEAVEWLGKKFDPTFFDIDASNRRLAE